MYGELEQTGDQWQLRFARRLEHSRDKVWRAVTDPEHLDVWFPQRVIGAWKVGGPLRFVGRVPDHPEFEGEVLAFEPPRLVEFRWGTDVIRIELDDDGGGCILTLTDTIEELGKAARDGAGWHACLDMLEESLAGAPPPWTSVERWAEVHPRYVERLGPAASTIGPPDLEASKSRGQET